MAGLLRVIFRATKVLELAEECRNKTDKEFALEFAPVDISKQVALATELPVRGICGEASQPCAARREENERLPKLNLGDGNPRIARL